MRSQNVSQLKINSLMSNNETPKFIVVAFYNHMAHFLQYRNVLSRIFYNNAPKPFATLQTAVKNANKVKAKYKVSSVKVYEIYPNQYISSAAFKEDDMKEIYKTYK